MHRENRNKHYKEKRKEMKRHLIACDQVIAGKDVELSRSTPRLFPSHGRRVGWVGWGWEGTEDNR